MSGGGAAVERLCSSYRQFWANAVTLSQQIQRDVPNLTLHDEAHFEALWARADQIAGSDLTLTPLELFVFGGAILLHDNANSIAAFSGGLGEIRATPEWQDAAAEWLERRADPVIVELPSEAHGAVLFEALRALHAQRAATLASLTVVTADASFHLLPDDQLRTHLGSLIGSIAASHHWDVADLPVRLPDRRGALAGMPADWSIRPILLACLLRCADATQLDQSRAPDFLYGLLRLHGVSESHWRAQNRLATPLVDPDDPHALLFTSTIPFGEKDADAWWIAFDAIQVANRELQAADALLRDSRLPSFAINRISGAESPARLAEKVSVEGWRPVAAEIKVTRVDKVVDLFGGEKLYGHDLSVPLRELIQNAADAVRLRRDLEPAGSPYEGRITVHLVPAEGAAHWLVVEDDGLGMSEAVLTGPLLDFGASYVSSTLVKAERPGLRSKSRRRIGRFGIGFFSCFMLADEVRVTSRPYDAGLDKCRTLHFRSGVVSRPLLLEGCPIGFNALLSTRIALLAPADKLADMLSLPSRFGSPGTSLTLEKLVGMLCPMLDVDVDVEDEAGRRRVHSRRWSEEDRATWLRRILVPEESENKWLLEDLESIAGLLTFVDPNDPSAGLAAISGTPAGGVTTIGTLLASGGRVFRDEWVGAIDHEPAGPRRSDGTPRAANLLPAWATDQAKRLAEAGIALPRRQYAAQRVARFGGDATPIASMFLNRDWKNIEEVFDDLRSGITLYAPLKNSAQSGERVVITMARNRHSGLLDSYRREEIEFLVPTLESPGDPSESDLYFVPTESDPAEVGFCSLLTRFAAERGYKLCGEIVERVDFAKYVGKPNEREGLMPGASIGGPGLKLWCIPVSGQ